ncbi:MAG: DUF1080 domain-containing protein, partial [Saprospiraceae bacterium]|nr:DUF1080 domain-containing protein [Saprospiraceae bacterium]
MRFITQHLTSLVALIFLLLSCNAGENSVSVSDHFEGDRPHNPWVSRSILDEQPRMLTAALHDDLWVAYHTDKGALYKAWKGGVNFDGAVYTTVHGPQPTTLGDGWFINDQKDPWTLESGGTKQEAEVKYLGHQFKEGRVYLNFELKDQAGKTVLVTESPEVFHVEDKYPGLERSFQILSNPNNVKVHFQGNAGSMTSAAILKSEGGILTKGKIETQTRGNRNCETAEYSLELSSEGATVVRSQFIDKPMIENPNKPEWETEEGTTMPPGFKLIARADCKTCHNTYRKTIGPGYEEIAQKYRNTPENVTMLAVKVKAGGTGVWGNQIMNAHPNNSMEDLTQMVEYIMQMDAEEEAKLAELDVSTELNEEDLQDASGEVEESQLFPGAAFKVMLFDRNIRKIADFKKGGETAVFSGIIPFVDASGGDFQGLEENFAFEIRGYINVPEDNQFTFRLTSDDGSRLYLHGEELIDHDGEHGADGRDATVSLKKGYHPFHIDFFQSRGGKAINLSWSPGATGTFQTVPSSAIAHAKSQQYAEGATLAMSDERRVPGDGYSLEEVHPSYDLSQARPDQFTPKVGGMDFLSDGRLVVSTWDPTGSVYILDNVDSGDPSQIKEKVIARGLAEPLGLAVIDDTIYVLQKQELTQLIDHDGDEIIDEYRTFANDWNVSANFHEFAFGLAYKDGYFYGALATAINPGGASTQPQIQDRGRVLKISKADGSVDLIASGLRTPNGIGIGYEGEVFVCDNQGDWLPSSKVLHVQEGAWYGSRSVDFEGTATMTETKPVVWLPQDEIGNSPSTPLAINDGPYKGQMIHAEVTHGGVKRVNVERVNGQLQGCVFRFIQGLEAGVNRMAWGPDGALYVGGIGSTGNWGHNSKLWYGLQRLKYNGESAFEMLAVRAKSNGVEIEFTEALKPGDGWAKEDYQIKQWYYKPTENYGGPKLDEKPLPILSVNVSEDRKKVFLELGGMKEDHVVYVRIASPFISVNGNGLWTTEGWYTMNNIPQGQPGLKTETQALANNTLSEWEKENGWELLFNGNDFSNWRGYKKDKVSDAWRVENGTMTLDTVHDAKGKWSIPGHNDIISNEQYENFELNLDWKIQS